MYYVRKSIGTLTTGDPWNLSYHYVCPTQLMPDDSPYQNNSERSVDALAVKKVTDSLTDNLKSRDTSASKNCIICKVGQS